MMVFPLMLIALLVIGLLVAGTVTLVVVMAARSKQPKAQSAAPLPDVPVTHEARQAILKKLADGELTKAEAEEQLTRLGSPVPESMPAPPPPSSGISKGCLVAVIMALILPIVLLVLFALLFFEKVSHTVDYAEPACIEGSVTVYPEVE